jgi:hypothetical protein
MLAVVAALALQPARADTLPPAAPADTVAAPATAAELLARARVARLRQDSALRSYDALSRERITATLSLRRDLPIARTVYREETAARVRWSRATGVELQLVGRRRFVSPPPFTRPPPPESNGDGTAPVPYYPGRDPLWIGGGAFASAEVDTTELLNPLAGGAERYYTYRLGGSVVIRVPGGAPVTLRELRVTPRRAHWRAVAGSYWFDGRTGQLVRAIYRPAGTLDLWRAGREQPDPANRPPRWTRWVFGQATGAIDAVTIEHGLYDGRVWLPRTQFAEGYIVAGPTRIGIRVEQSFRYDGVNSALPPARPVPPAALALRARADSFALADSLRGLARDSALAAARTGRDSSRIWRAYRAWERDARAPLAAARDSLRAAGCRATGESARTRLRYGRRLPARVFVPCDEARLAASPVFDAPILSEGEGPWQAVDVEALRTQLAAAGGATAAWAPLPPTLHAGAEYTRYNRVEGLATGGAVRQTLGRGWRWEGSARYGFADRQPNAELFAERALDRRGVRGGAYRRLAQADDYGAAFAGGASLQNLVSGLDEQFYYRAAGAELAGWREGVDAAALRPLGLPLGAALGPLFGVGRLDWRLFAERQDRADPRARFTFGRDVLDRPGAAFDRNVIDTVPARGGAVAGAAARWRGARGTDASPWRLRADARVEAAAGTFAYLRPALDLTAERALPGALVVRVGAGGGSALGDLPPQRWWNVGGWQTVRGVTAGSRRGPAFWTGRAEAQWNGWTRAQPALFVDAGWAGRPADWERAFGRGAGVRSAGAGVGLLNGLLRVDAARPLGNAGRWRVSGYAVARW